jgi:hypothetical protein
MRLRPVRQLLDLYRMHGMATPLRRAIASFSLQSRQEVWHVQQPDVSNLTKHRNITKIPADFHSSLQGNDLPVHVLGLHVFPRCTEPRRR